MHAGADLGRGGGHVPPGSIVACRLAEGLPSKIERVGYVGSADRSHDDQIDSLLVTIAVVLGGLIGLAVLGGIDWLVYRARQDRPGRPVAAPGAYQVRLEPQPELPPSRKAAIGPGRELHINLHGLTPDQIAAIVTPRGANLEDR
jgi:hypothetical protein